MRTAAASRTTLQPSTRTRDALLAGALLVGMLLAGCGGGDSQTLCAGLNALAGGGADAQTLMTSDEVDEVHAAADRMTDRITKSVSTLRGISAGDFAYVAGRLADVEEKALPILEKFRAGTSPSNFGPPRTAYRSWTYLLDAVATDSDKLLADKKISCG